MTKKAKKNFEFSIPPVKAITAVQKEFFQALATKDVIVFMGSAGTGKSFCAMSEVSDWLRKGLIDEVVITRPPRGMGKSVGFLKGGDLEKMLPWVKPLVDVMVKRYGQGWVDCQLSLGNLQILLMEHARGHSINGVFVVDEGQLTTPDEMYSLVTRMEEGSKLIVLGDPTQNDLPGTTGIQWLVDMVTRHPSLEEHIAVIEGSSDDIVRGEMCKLFVKAKEKDIQRGIRYD